MKKLFPLLIAFTLLFSFPLPTFAAESNDRQQNTSFEISLEEALALADPADITVQNGITTIPVKLDIIASKSSARIFVFPCIIYV